MKEFADRLKELRLEKGLTLKQLADAIQVSPMALSRWERNIQDPAFSNVKKIAIYFQVSTDYLGGLED